MQIDDTVVVAGFSAVGAAVLGLAGYVRFLHGKQITMAEDQLSECKDANRRCEARSDAQQEQIDALIDGDHERAKAKRATDHLLPIQILLLPLVCLLLSSCADARQDERQQQTANSGATIYEAAVAIEQGVPAAQPLAAIKLNASAICTANGHPYPIPPAAPAADLTTTTKVSP